MYILTFILLAAALTVDGQYASYGKCPSVKVVENFDASAFMGEWYQTSAYPQWFQTGCCAKTKYTLNSDGESFSILNSEISDGKINTITGTGSLASIDGSANLEITLDVKKWKQSSPLKVLIADYNDYAALYSCIQFGLLKFEFAWLLSRDATMSSAGKVAVNEYILTYGVLDVSKFEETDQSEASWCSVSDNDIKDSDVDSAVKHHDTSKSDDGSSDSDDDSSDSDDDSSDSNDESDDSSD